MAFKATKNCSFSSVWLNIFIGFHIFPQNNKDTKNDQIW